MPILLAVRLPGVLILLPSLFSAAEILPNYWLFSFLLKQSKWHILTVFKKIILQQIFFWQRISGYPQDDRPASSSLPPGDQDQPWPWARVKWWNNWWSWQESSSTVTSHVDPRHWISSCVGPFLCAPTKSTLTRLTSRSDRPGGAVCMLSFAAWMTLPSWSQFCYGLVGSLLRSGAPVQSSICVRIPKK